jgi:hypothetical protein
MDGAQQKQELSIAYARAVAAAAGFAVSEPSVDDDSIDIGFIAGTGFTRRPRVEAQLKCSADDVLGDKDFAFPLSLKNYDDLRAETLVPRILIVVRVPEDPDDWVHLTEKRLLVRYCGYWLSLDGEPATANTTSVTVRMLRSQIFNGEQLTAMMLRVEAGKRP